MFADYIDGLDYELSAAQHIDVLTGFRIEDFSALTPFQQNIVLSVHEKLTDFERENADVLDSFVTAYGINGVSMSFGDRVKEIGGVVIPADLYSLLCATGLCYPAV